MNKIYFFAAIVATILLWSQSSYAQSSNNTDSHITGHVINKKTGEHLPFIDIVLEGSTIGTTTDATGHFFLKNLPIGEFTLTATALGYIPKSIKVKIIKKNTIEIKFEIEEDAVLLEGTVISANLSATNRKETPNIVNVITPKLFAKTNAVALSEGLCFQPGLRVENDCQNCGFQQVRINGMEGHYSQILIDNRAITSALSAVYGLEQIPVNMIDRVEVVKGGGSAIFGANAVAGTINIITKEAYANAFQISNTTTLIGMHSVDNSTNINGTIVSDNNKIGVAIFGAARYREGYDHNKDGFTEIPTINSKNIGARGYFRTSNKTKLTAEYHTIYEYRRGGDSLNRPPHEAMIAEEVKHNINTGSLKYDIYLDEGKHWLQLYSSLQHVNRDSYYGTNHQLDAYGKTTDLTNVNGAQYVWRIKKCWFMPSNFTAGLEYSYSKLLDVTPSINRKVEQAVNQYSAFVQNEWKNRDLTLLAGVRIDYHSLLNKPVISPRVNIRYTPSPYVALRIGYAGGFRAPQVFDEDLHILAAGGELTYIVNDPNLKEERSNSFNLSADFNKRWDNGAFTFLLDGFYTDLNNVFYLEDQEVEGGLLKRIRKNGSGAYVAGATAECKIIPLKDFDIQLGFTYQQSRYKEPYQWTKNIPAQKKMFRSPDTYGFITVNYSPFKRFEIGISGIYTGEMLIQHYGAGVNGENIEVTTPDFFDMGIKVAYDIRIGENSLLKLDLGMKNIFDSYQKDFDKGSQRDSGYIYGPMLPRSIYVAAKYRF